MIDSTNDWNSAAVRNAMMLLGLEYDSAGQAAFSFHQMYSFTRPEIAKQFAEALRLAELRGRAMGMREAARIVDASKSYVRNSGKPWAEDVPSSKTEIVASILAAADKLTGEGG